MALLSHNVGRAPAALNFADDTGWGTHWLRLERPYGHQNGGRCRPKTAIKGIQSTILVDFCV